MMETKLIYKIFLSTSHLFNLSIFLFLFMIISKITQNQVKENVYINDLIENWYSRGIKEIYIPEHKETCESYLFTREWEGVEPACDCRKNFFTESRNSQLYKGKCSLLRLFLGCQSINGADKQFTNKWKGSVLCIRHSDTNYFDSVSVINSKCPKKYNLCGVDSKNFSLCFPKTTGCPINKIKITNGMLTTPHENKPFQSLKLSNDWYLHFSNSFVNETQTIDVKYSEGRICINPSETNLKLNYFKYKSENGVNSNNTQSTYCSTKIGRYNYDERYKSLDSVSKFKYYFDNDLIRKIDNLPQINSQELINYSIYLYQRGYIYWSPYCRQDVNLNPERIVNDVLDVIKIESYFDFAGAILVTIFTCYIVLVIASLIFRFLHVQINLSDRSKKTLEKIFKHSLSAIIVLTISLVILLILILFILNDHRNISRKFSDLKCGDYLMNSSFNDVGTNLNDLFYYGAEFFMGSIILSTALLVNRLIR